jgi:hypothetical protein
MILTEIGGRALGAVNRRWTIVIGERLRKDTRAVIVQVADLVGQRIHAKVVMAVVMVMMVMMMVPVVVMPMVVGSGLRHSWIKGQQSQNGAGSDL